MTNCCQLWLLLVLVLNKCRKNIKKDSIRNPKARNLFVGSHFDQNLQCYSTPIVLTTRVRRIFKEGE